MNHRFRISAFLAVLLILAASPSFAWKFVSIADSRGDNNGVNTTILTKIVNRINAEGVDLVIFQGDAIDQSITDAMASSYLDTFISVMNKLNCPWYFSPGNHDIESATAESVLRSKISMPTNGPAGYEETVYSFDYQNAHFVSLNSNHWKEAHRVQRSWLAADLAKTVQPHVFVMAHEPAYPTGPHIGSSLDVYSSERDDFWNKMTAGRVSMFFCGHEHLYSRTKRGSIYQIINGSCGAPLKTGVSGTIAKYSYVVVDIQGYTVRCQAKDENGVLIDSWSYTVPSVSTPSISLSLSADKASAVSGDTITYSIRYTNNGEGAASNVKIKMPVPPNTSYISGGAYDSAANTVTWAVSSVPAGGSGNCTMQVKVK
jgi:Icc protein